MDGAAAVLDIGKTNVKVATFARDGALLWERAMPNRVLPGPPYPHADVEKIWDFLIAALAEANRAHPISTIVATTHACTVGLIDDKGLVLPVMDYEFAGVDEIEPSYAPLRPAFSESFSPPLPAGLNFARQLAWQKQSFPEAFTRARYFLTYPQYWAWRLCGIAAGEVTFLGAHSDLWAPRERRFSSVVAALGLNGLMPPMRAAYARLGPVKPDIAAAAGLGEGRRRALRRSRFQCIAAAASRLAQGAVHDRLDRHLGDSDGAGPQPRRAGSRRRHARQCRCRGAAGRHARASWAGANMPPSPARRRAPTLLRSPV